MAIGLEKLIGKKYISIFLTVILFNIVLFVYFSFLFHDQVNQRMELYDTVKSKNISNAIVFLNPISLSVCCGTMYALDLTRNDIYFNNSILYVLDLNEKNILLMKNFPDREYYLWKCEEIKIKYIKLFDFEKSKNINCALTKLDLN